MKKAPKPTPRSRLRREYDFSHGVRGKYAARFAAGTNLARLDPDVAERFPDSQSVNRALRDLAALVDRATGATTR